MAMPQPVRGLHRQNAKQLLLAVLVALVVLYGTLARGEESDPLPVPQGSPHEAAVRLYNDGVTRLLARDFAQAQRLFEQALALEETLAEAHNNLAYSLRMQGARNFERSLSHYNRAIELKPTLAQAYMYRGILFTQRGDMARARADHARLLTLDRELAVKLEHAITHAPGVDAGVGISAQYE